MFGCKNKRLCRVQNCSKYHNRQLHSELSSKNYSQRSLQVQNDSSNVNDEKRKEEPDNYACCIDEHSFQVRSVTKTVLLRIIPVKVIGIKKSVETFALFDEGSTVTLIDANLAEDIGVQGFNDPLKMYRTNSSSYIDNHSRKVSVKIQGNLDDQIHDLDNVRTVSNLNLPIQSVDIEKFANR
ncbi:hypothetical protein JTB14_020215 [Gonioctena quinquepunctata]|nr:hypothetical protein JTB14_020215 [Gonioctena quinquepunctata]